MTLAELGSRMSSAEFGLWLAFEKLEPFGPRQEELRAGQIAATIANGNRGRGSREPFTAADFFPSLREPERPVDLGAKLRAVFSHFPRGKALRKPKGT